MGKTGVTMNRAAIIASLFCLLTAACASSGIGQPRMAAGGGFQALGQDNTGALLNTVPTAPAEYRLGPFDKIGVAVYQMTDLTFPEVQVDASGSIVLPQVGTLNVAGKTTRDVSFDIATKLAECCLRDPQVTVTLREALSQQVTVSGAVRNQGVISLRGATTLGQVVAMAGGADMASANPHAVLVLRNINGQRSRAVFDLDAISKGMAPDPQILAGDSIVVDTSQAKSAVKAALASLPFLGVFTLF